MGTVHVARDTELLRKVALKALSAEFSASSARVRFVREVQITAQLDHPHIVPVYSLEMAPGGTPAYAMKLVEGRTLSEYLEETCRAHESGAPPDEAHALPARLEHFLKICDAIDYAHGKGVIHRDLKPANVMLGRHNEIYVMDWGICRILKEVADDVTTALAHRLSEDAGETREGSVLGTPAFMSPEQAQGRTRALGPASDQCALGLLLYTVVTLRVPYEGKTALEVLNQAATGRLGPLKHAYERRPIPGELAAIIRKATAPKVEDRYPSVRALADDLRRFLRGGAVLARPDNLWRKAGRALARHRQLTLAGILGLLVLGLGSELYLIARNQRAVDEIRRREERRQAVSTALVERGDRLQTRFLALQSELESFAFAAEQALLFGKPSPDRYYLAADYGDPNRAPPDLAPAPGHSGRVSHGWSAWTFPRGVSRVTADQTIRRLQSLQPLRRRLFQRAERALVGSAPAVSAAKGGPPPILGLVLGLENGIASHYPGEEGTPTDYDPRDRPWYTLANGKKDTQWGHPFPSSVSRIAQLPLSMAIDDDRGKLLGVASLLLSVDHLARELLDPQGLPAVRETMLLDADGVVMIERTREASAVPTRLEPFPDRAVLAAIAKRQRSTVSTEYKGQKMVAAFDRLAPVDWTLLALADEDELFAGASR